ncbi:hypothetical protein HK096_008773 [Nowakowskiella sp. JEL0078]|nr:hypothetical protein HK096_008773 [Nowakowskiella sp. JEL0078]
MLEIPKQHVEEEYSRLTSAKIAMQLQNKQTEKENENNVDDEDEDSAVKINNLNRAGLMSAKKKMRALNFEWITSLGFIFLILASVALTSFVQLSSMIQTGRRLDLTLRIRYITQRLAFCVQELALKKFSPLYNDTVIRDWISDDISDFNSIQFALLFGDVNLGLSPGRLPLALNETMFFPKWGNPPQSTDETVNILLQDIKTVLESQSISLTHPKYLNIMRIYQYIVNGYSLAAEVNLKIFENKISTTTTLTETVTIIGIVLILVIYTVSFRKILRFLETENKRVKKLLSKIPPETAEQNLALQTLLLGSLELAKEYVKDTAKGNVNEEIKKEKKPGVEFSGGKNPINNNSKFSDWISGFTTKVIKTDSTEDGIESRKNETKPQIQGPKIIFTAPMNSKENISQNNQENFISSAQKLNIDSPVPVFSRRLSLSYKPKTPSIKSADNISERRSSDSYLDTEKRGKVGFAKTESIIHVFNEDDESNQGEVEIERNESV